MKVYEIKGEVRLFNGYFELHSPDIVDTFHNALLRCRSHIRIVLNRSKIANNTSEWTSYGAVLTIKKLLYSLFILSKNISYEYIRGNKPEEIH